MPLLCYFKSSLFCPANLFLIKLFCANIQKFWKQHFSIKIRQSLIKILLAKTLNWRLTTILLLRCFFFLFNSWASRHLRYNKFRIKTAWHWSSKLIKIEKRTKKTKMKKKWKVSFSWSNLISFKTNLWGLTLSNRKWGAGVLPIFKIKPQIRRKQNIR